MASGTNFKTYDPVAQLIASGSGSGGTPNSIPGAFIQNGTVTNTQLALGAAASNINAGPPGSINVSQIAGGPFLPLTGGTMSGQITQSLTPIDGTDLVNKTYVDGNFQVKKPAAVPNNIAFFGSGADTGQTIDSTYNIDTNLANPPSNNTLWPSSRLIGALQYGANVYKSTTSISLGGGANVKAFSTGNAVMGPSSWPNIGSTFSLALTGIATISNSLEYTTYYRIIFSANSLSESTNAFGSVECQIQDEAGPSFITIPKILNCLAAPPAFSNEVYLSCLVSIPPTSSFNFSVIMTNLGLNSVTIDPIAPSNACILVIERVA